jgi:hydroxymethylglutaryl-CoA reductase
MENKKVISGFSKLSKTGKLKWIVENFFKDPEQVMRELSNYWLLNEDEQKVIDGFSENTISNFILPYGVAPNFLINNKEYCVPMVIEESSVVAAASSSAKYWFSRGGFKAEVLGTIKIGQVHFRWHGEPSRMFSVFDDLKDYLLIHSADITANMEQRGGGVIGMELLDFTKDEPGYFQIRVSFETCDSMGANFINTVLERFARRLELFFMEHPGLPDESRDVQVIMSILSNFTPDCLVRATVECPVSALGSFDGMSSEEFAEKFKTAVKIAHLDPYRATTHNKGIFNGVDAVVLATANDFRAIEACGHAYAARNGSYKSLSNCEVSNGVFKFWLDIPLALGTIGGLTSLHPIAKRSLELLDHPTASELMCIVASTGLAQNFAAVRSLVTTGIQKGHMKMHLMNILNHLGADPLDIQNALVHFEDKTVSYSAVRDFLKSGHSVSVKK